MIELKDAKKKAKTYYTAFPLCDTTIDIGDAWVFSYDTGNLPIPGVPSIMIQKQTGHISMTPTPATESNIDKLEEFFQRLDAGIVIQI